MPPLFHSFGACRILLLHGFVAKQTCFHDRSLIYRYLPYFFLYLQSFSVVNYLITYFVSLLCPCQYDLHVVCLFVLLTVSQRAEILHLDNIQFINLFLYGSCFGCYPYLS